MRVEQIGDATLYCADCREVLPTLCGVDAVVTDPPYGVGLNYAEYVDSDQNERSGWLGLMRSTTRGPMAVSCGIANLTEWEKPDWVLSWYKPNSMRRVMPGWNTWEPVLLYGRPRGVKTHDCFVVSVVAQSDTGDHPCPKPLGWGIELINRLTTSCDLVLDPFMGSGTTGVACARLGRRFIGIEIHEPYFDIACRRIEEAQRQRDLFIHAPADPEDTRMADLFAAAD